MFEDLAAILALRNARFRAWRAYGVPVAGGWHPKAEPAIALALLGLSCLRCNRTTTEYAPCFPMDLRIREEMERRCVRALAGMGCPHLAPLLGDDPPEVVALTKLELLAGDPPR